MLEREVEHGVDVVLVAGGHHHHVGEDPQVGQVIAAVVGGTVGADQPGPVQTEDDRQVLERNLLENLIVRSLEKRAVDIDDRSGPGLGHAGGERDGVTLADAHVEELAGKRVANLLQFVALAHGGREDGHAGNRGGRPRTAPR